MKCNYSLSQGTSMSVDRYSLKFRILALVVNTANLINERTTSTLNISHAILAPAALGTTYIFLGILAIAAVRRKYASEFMQIYGLICCAALQISLSITVFKGLKNRNNLTITHRDIGLVLNGVLPMFTIILIIADLIVLMFSKRDDISLPSSDVSSGPASPRSSDDASLPARTRQQKARGSSEPNIYTRKDSHLDLRRTLQMDPGMDSQRDPQRASRIDLRTDSNIDLGIDTQTSNKK